MRIWSTLILVLVGYSVAAAEEIAISSKGPSATIIEKRNSNTSRALLVAKVRETGAREYCERDPGGITSQFGGHLSVRECIETTIAEFADEPIVARANCEALVVVDSFGRVLRATNEDKFGSILWTSLITGKSIGTCGACGDSSATSQFRALCSAAEIRVSRGGKQVSPPLIETETTAECLVKRNSKTLSSKPCRMVVAKIDPCPNECEVTRRFVWPDGDVTVVQNIEESWSLNGVALPQRDVKYQGNGFCLRNPKSGNTFCFADAGKEG